MRAKGDLALARAPLPEGAFYEDLCFHAQQAAEKAMKSVYQHHGWIFRYVHDLEELLSGLKKQGLKIPTEIEQTIVLTSFASESRYPGFSEPVSVEEHEEAVKLAQIVIAWAESEIGA